MISVDTTSEQVSGRPFRAPGALRALVHRRHGVPSGMLASPDGLLEQTMFFTRGSTLRSTLDYLDHALSGDQLAVVMDRLPLDDRRTIEQAAVTDDVPYALALALWRSADIVLREVNPRWAEDAGAEAIMLRGMQLYSGLLKKPTPVEFLTQHISLFQRYYRPGDMKVTERSAGRATARLIGFEPGDRLFCRRLTGGWRAAITIAGAREPVVHHARCVLEGDMFCEWEVRWK